MNQISWGDRLVDLQLPRPKTGSLLLLRQDRKELHSLVLRIIADELADGYPAHWIDGGMRFDPSPLLTMLMWRGGSEDAMNHFHICRGFTAYQTAAIIERLTDEALGKNNSKIPSRLLSGRVIVVSDLARMFADPQINPSEGRALLRVSVEKLKILAQSTDSLVIITTRRKTSPPLPKALNAVLNQSINDCLSVSKIPRYERKKRGKSARENLRLHLSSVDISIPWARLSVEQSSLLEFRNQIQATNEVCTERPLLIRSSVHPSGDSNALTARTASGS